jgi:hypothetical protein
MKGRQLLDRFGVAALWLLLLFGWKPWVGLGVMIVLGLASVVARNPFLGIGLAALTAPLAMWLIEHPAPVWVICCGLLSWPILWWYRREIRRGA